MAGKLPERNPTNILPAQFWDVFIDWVVYAQFAAKGSQRDQCSIEHLAHRRQVEQGIRGDFPFLCSTGEAVIAMGSCIILRNSILIASSLARIKNHVWPAT